MLSRVKYEFVRTPLEGPLTSVRSALSRWRHPELRDVYLEGGRIGAAFRRVRRGNSNCIDIGCRYGSMLSRFCRLAKKGRHLAFEPTPEKVRFLRRKFPEVDVRERALSDRPGKVKFYVNRRQTGLSGFAQYAAPIYGEAEFEPIEVRCARLDDVVPRDRRFDLLKLDVEGAELLVLRGATELLNRDRPTIFFECGPLIPQIFGYRSGDLYELLTGCDYLIFLPTEFLAQHARSSRATGAALREWANRGSATRASRRRSTRLTSATKCG